MKMFKYLIVALASAFVFASCGDDVPSGHPEETYQEVDAYQIINTDENAADLPLHYTLYFETTSNYTNMITWESFTYVTEDEYNIQNFVDAKDDEGYVLSFSASGATDGLANGDYLVYAYTSVSTFPGKRIGKMEFTDLEGNKRTIEVEVYQDTRVVKVE